MLEFIHKYFHEEVNSAVLDLECYQQSVATPLVCHVLPGDCMSTSLTSASPPAGPLLSFDVNDNTAFEIPLSNVSQCATGKNEVTLEFHQTDDTEVSLMEVRFYVPPSQSDERQDPVEVRAKY